MYENFSKISSIKTGRSRSSNAWRTALLGNNTLLENKSYVSVYTDISEQKHEKEIQEKEERYSLMTQALNAVVLDWNLEDGSNTFTAAEGSEIAKTLSPEFLIKMGGLMYILKITSPTKMLW